MAYPAVHDRVSEVVRAKPDATIRATPRRNQGDFINFADFNIDGGTQTILPSVISGLYIPVIPMDRVIINVGAGAATAITELRL